MWCTITTHLVLLLLFPPSILDGGPLEHYYCCTETHIGTTTSPPAKFPCSLSPLFPSFALSLSPLLPPAAQAARTLMRTVCQTPPKDCAERRKRRLGGGLRVERPCHTFPQKSSCCLKPDRPPMLTPTQSTHILSSTHTHTLPGRKRAIATWRTSVSAKRAVFHCALKTMWFCSASPACHRHMLMLWHQSAQLCSLSLCFLSLSVCASAIRSPWLDLNRQGVQQWQRPLPFTGEKLWLTEEKWTEQT